MLLKPSRPALLHLTVVKNKNKRDTQNAELGGQHLVCVNVQFADSDLAF
jgi:hypothetical protein